MFERFYRSRGHASPGAGLGLAIVREGALRLGGAVRLDDGIGGRGCTFTVTLPPAPIATIADALPGDTPGALPGDTTGEKKDRLAPVS